MTLADIPPPGRGVFSNIYLHSCRLGTPSTKYNTSLCNMEFGTCLKSILDQYSRSKLFYIIILIEYILPLARNGPCSVGFKYQFYKFSFSNISVVTAMGVYIEKYGLLGGGGGEIRRCHLGCVSDLLYFLMDLDP